MNHFQRYRPNFFSGFEEPDDTMSFANTQEMMDSVHGKRWLSSPDLIGIFADMEPGGVFSPKRQVIMMDVKRRDGRPGREWWVLGFCTGDRVDLPEWKSPTKDEHP